MAERQVYPVAYHHIVASAEITVVILL